MNLANIVSVGIDTTSGSKSFTYAALDTQLGLVALAEAEMDEVIAFLDGQSSAIVAINSASHVNAGVIERRLRRQNPPPHALRGAEIRAAEFDLRALGIPIGATPRSEALCPSWVQVGFALYRRLSKSGFKVYHHENASHQWLETHPHAAFCVLLGRSPLPKPSLEGRLQRALVLFERGLRIRDPMTFLEEITRHKLLNGVLPVEILPSPEQLDALVAAYTAWLAALKPNELTQVGNQQEGYITLPTHELKERY